MNFDLKKPVEKNSNMLSPKTKLRIKTFKLQKKRKYIACPIPGSFNDRKSTIPDI